jgi:membrane protease YdiL (CAAX protease family)
VPNAIDALVASLIVVVYPVWEYFVSWPRAKARLEAGEPGTRRKLYRNAILTQWIAVAIVAVLWIAFHRPATALYLHLPGGARLVFSIGLIIGVVAIFAIQHVSVLRASSEVRVALRPKLGYATSILPRTADEYRWFLPLAMTAGICEEILYRGYVIWLLSALIGLWPAAVASVVLFGIAHAYLGTTGVVRATLVGALLALLVVVLRSLFPVMIIHAVVDLAAGMLGYAVLREQTGDAAVSASSPAG